MKWNKQGLIYGASGDSSWAKNSALQPTPLIVDEETIRVFVGMRDEKGRSRVGFVDVDAENPKNVLRVSEKPALDLGMPGTFDENGVVPCAVESECAVFPASLLSAIEFIKTKTIKFLAAKC